MKKKVLPGSRQYLLSYLFNKNGTLARFVLPRIGKTFKFMYTQLLLCINTKINYGNE